MDSIKTQLENGSLILGLELGSTRIKAVLIGDDHMPVAEGSYTWENQLIDGIWTYSMEEVWKGIQEAYRSCSEDAEKKYQASPRRLAAIGVSAMMHGYLAFDEQENLLVNFRTWRNTITKEASTELTALFNYNIPQRWSIAHLYQAVLNKEEHIPFVRSIMTLAAYVHYKLTGKKVIGIGDASGMFPIDVASGDYNRTMLKQLSEIESIKALPWEPADLLPRVLKAGQDAGCLTSEGALLLDPTGKLESGCPCCPPEGDAQTGMIATNSVRIHTGNVSAGTSDFAILVLDKELSRVYPEIDLVTSPSGALAANVHCNNCTTDLNAWVSLFQEFSKDMGLDLPADALYTYLYRKALEAEKDAGGVLSYNYYSGEGITDLDEGRPLLVRKPDARFNLANLMRSNLYSCLATLKIGMDLITKEENMSFDRIMAHGGLFKTKLVGQKILAAALNTPITVMETAELGGAWGIALLADYLIHKGDLSLDDWLDQKIFGDKAGDTVQPDPKDAEGFDLFMKTYKEGLAIERSATIHF